MSCLPETSKTARFTFGLVGAAFLALTACGNHVVIDRSLATLTVGIPSAGFSTPSASPERLETAPPANVSPGELVVQGSDNDNDAYGAFKVTMKVAPHLENVDYAGNPYSPADPLQPDGTCITTSNAACDAPGYEFIHFTLTFTNPTSKPEVFGTVGFSPALRPMVYLVTVSADGGTTPADAKFGGPTDGAKPVTKQNMEVYWEANRDGPGNLFGFPEELAKRYFLFSVSPGAKYAQIGGPAIPDMLQPGQSFDIEYASGPVAPTAPLAEITVWAGYHPQQVQPPTR